MIAVTNMKRYPDTIIVKYAMETMLTANPTIDNVWLNKIADEIFRTEAAASLAVYVIKTEDW